MAHRLEPSASATARYKEIYHTAINFISAQTQDPSIPSRMDFDRIRTLCAPDFQHSWGHKYAVSRAPLLQGSHSVDGFIAHLQKMLPNLESWKTDISDIIVDEAQLKVVLRLSFWMRAKGMSEVDIVENDLLWLLEMSEEVDKDRHLKIWKSTEFVDGVAAEKLKEIMSRQR